MLIHWKFSHSMSHHHLWQLGLLKCQCITKRYNYPPCWKAAMILLYQEKKIQCINRIKKPFKKTQQCRLHLSNAGTTFCMCCMSWRRQQWTWFCELGRERFFVRCSFIRNVLIVKVKGLVIILAHCITGGTSSKLFLGQKPLYFINLWTTIT